MTRCALHPARAPEASSRPNNMRTIPSNHPHSNNKRPLTGQDAAARLGTRGLRPSVTSELPTAGQPKSPQSRAGVTTNTSSRGFVHCESVRHAVRPCSEARCDRLLAGKSVYKLSPPEFATAKRSNLKALDVKQ